MNDKSYKIWVFYCIFERENKLIARNLDEPFCTLSYDMGQHVVEIFTSDQNKSNLYFAICFVKTKWGEPLFNETGWCMHPSIKYSTNGTLPERHQATNRTSVGMFSQGPPGDKLSEIVIQVRSFLLKIIYCKMLFAKISATLTQSQCVKAPDGYSFNCSSKFLAWSVKHQLYIIYIHCWHRAGGNSSLLRRGIWMTCNHTFWLRLYWSAVISKIITLPLNIPLMYKGFKLFMDFNIPIARRCIRFSWMHNWPLFSTYLHMQVIYHNTTSQTPVPAIFLVSSKWSHH